MDISNAKKGEGHSPYLLIGNKTKMTAPDGKMTTYAYDTNNRLTQTLADAGQSFSFVYDSLNRRTKLTYPNGITANYTYDAISRLTNLLHKTSSNSTIDSFTYTYDNISNKLTAIDTAGSHQYQYDAIYRLTGANHPTTSDEAYTYDPVGNRLTDIQARNYTYNTGNELLTQNGTSFTYDANGNITTKTDATGTTLYQYDYENRLIQVNTQPVTGNPQLITYKYDPFGRRIEKKTTTGNKSKTTKYLYDREDILYEYDNAGAITTKYIHGPGIDEPLAMIKGSNTYYYHADGLGSITTITNSRARISQQYKYDSFGNITYMKDTRFVQPYTYTGREYDSETGLYYDRARYYDARVGRFISFDPIQRGVSHTEGNACSQSTNNFPLQQPQEMNPFIYVGNNPVNLTDASGLCPEVPDTTFVQTAIRTGQIPVQITYLISCKLVKSEKVKIDSKCFEKCYYNCKQTWSWVAPESGKTFGGKTTFPKQYEFKRDASECCK